MPSTLELAAFSALRGQLVSAGDITGYSSVFKFGYNGEVGPTEETIWDQGGAYSHPTSPETMTISSSSANDTAAGTGAQTVEVYGLDGDYLDQNAVWALNGQSGVTISPDLLRTNRAVVRSAGSLGQNDGTIYVGSGAITSGVPANIYTTIQPGENQTLQSFYTVPARMNAYLTMVWTSSFGNANSVATIRLKARPEGEVFQTKDKFLLTRNSIKVDHFFPVPFPEKTDIELTGIAGSGTLDVSGSFELLLVRY